MMGHPEENINGPSLVRVPGWVRQPLGRYYLYFAHHEGAHLRLAYADALEGPWRIHEPGVLHVRDTGWNPDHVASPDVLIDEERRQIRLYFHAPVTPVPRSSDPDYQEKLLQARQDSFVALSDDGLHFRVLPQSLGPSYFRVWRWRGCHYPECDYEGAGLPVAPSQRGAALGHEHAVRDPALYEEDGRLYLLYSVAGERGIAMARLRAA